MKLIKMENSSVNDVYSGVYKITFPNNKSYIGISNNIYRRMLEHNTDFRHNLPIEKAILKYGKITEFEILEEISPNNRNLMREREKYWIKFYKSNNKDFGYNISEGGDGADIGSNNHEAKFTEEEIQSIYSDLKEKLTVSIEELANKYGVHMTTMSKINNGQSYYHSNISYPIRAQKDCKYNVSGLKNSNSYLNEELLNKIILALAEEQDVPMTKLAERFNISSTIIQNINSGKRYYNNELHYPIRKPKTGAKKLEQNQVEQIIQQIKNFPKKSLAQIGRDFQVSAKTISGINNGIIYKQENEKYPIR